MSEGAAGPFDVCGDAVASHFDGKVGSWPFGSLRPMSYSLIMADPPWPTQMRSAKGLRKSAEMHYQTMSLQEIATLPVHQLAADDCVLFMWCTWPLLLHSGDPKRHYADPDASFSPVGAIIKAWGFRYVTGGAWLKRGRKGGILMGPGYRARTTCEPFLLATYGNPKNSRGSRNFIDGVARGHSVKPEEGYAWCETYMPGARRVELFSRTPRKDWDSWGNEAGKFTAGAEP
jgi:N6-adenosine-specific RNA methylase IME4